MLRGLSPTPTALHQELTNAATASMSRPRILALETGRGADPAYPAVFPPKAARQSQSTLSPSG